MTTNKFATRTWVGTQTKAGGYTGTGEAFDISVDFAPKRIEVVEDDTGEFTMKTNQQSSAKCFLRKKFGADQVIKSYSLTQNGISFGADKVTIGTSSYINETDKTYSYTIWG